MARNPQYGLPTIPGVAPQKLFSGAAFRDGTHRVYFAPGQGQIVHSTAFYQAPPDWPRAGAPVAVPKVCRLTRPADAGEGFAPWTQVAADLDDELQALDWNTSCNPATRANDILEAVTPLPADAASGLFLGTDTLHLLILFVEGFGIYWPDGVIFFAPFPTAAYNADRAVVVNAHPVFRRTQTWVYFDTGPRAVETSTPLNAILYPIWRSQMPGKIQAMCNDLAAYGFVYKGTTNYQTATAANFLQDIKDHFDLN